MAVNKHNNFNRIINLSFLVNKGGDKGEYKKISNLDIKCPLRGRKPSIEITGSFSPDDCLPPFNVTVKNLYMDIPESQYPQIEVEAGYENSLQTFRGTILSMYQESPGPESTTVIQCYTGTTKTWLDEIVTLQLDEGFKLTDALQKIADSMGLRTVYSDSVKQMVSKTSIQFEGKPQDAIAKLKTMFSVEKLIVTVRTDELRAYSQNDTKGLNDVELKFLSSPPQQAAGSNGIVYATLVAPWIPTLRPGDKVTYNAWQFMKAFSVSKQEKASIIVNSIQFHFGTTGSVNQMTIQGYAV